MTTLISYAQNFEDVMLWRALKHVDKGRYIDIGAQGPVIDSVSKFFHGQGWHGIHVEPIPSYAEQLRQERPGDIVLQAAVGNRVGTLKFYEFPDTGLSTDDRVVAKKHLKDGFSGREIVVPCITLDNVFSHYSNQEIHWLKIDVEGGEQRVLKSWLRSKARPWIVLVESTLPLSQQESHQKWESILLSKGYQFAYFDGLNRFYVADKHLGLLKAFSAGPNLFDGFVLSQSSWPWCASLNFQLQSVETKLDAERKAAAALLQQREAELQAQLDKLFAVADQQERVSVATHADLMSRLTASQQAAADAARELANTQQAYAEKFSASQSAILEVTQKLAKREAELNAKLTVMLDESTRLVHAFTEREREFAKQLAESAEASKGELLSSRRQIDEVQRVLTAKESELIELRQAMAWQVQSSGQELALNNERASLRYSQLEDSLGKEIAQLRTNLSNSVESFGVREHALEAQLLAAHQKALGATEALAAREREFADQFQVLESLLRSEISEIEAEKMRLQQAVVERDQRLADLCAATEREAASAAQALAKKDLFHSETLATCESQLRAEVLSVELALARARGQLDASGLESLSLREELAKSRNEVKQLTVNLANSGVEVVLLRQELSKSESEVLALAAQKDDQERVATQQILAAQAERQELDRSSALRYDELRQEIDRLTAELAHSRETTATFKRQLTAQLQDVSETLQQRGAQVAMLQRTAKAMANSVSWKLTAPLRSIGALLGLQNNYDVGSTFAGESGLGKQQDEPSVSSRASTIESPVISAASTVSSQSYPSAIDFESHLMKSDEIRYRDLATLSGADFVEGCYQRLLHRSADQTGRAGYINALNLGTSKAEIIQSILTSDEGKREGAHVEGLWLAVLPRRLERLPLIGSVVSSIALMIKSRAMLRSMRASENLASTIDDLQKQLLIETEADKFQHKFDQLAPAFLHTISSANTFMHECRQRLSEIERLVNGVPRGVSPIGGASVEERLLAMEKMLASRDALLDEVQRILEPVQNLVNSVPISSRSTARTLTELRSQLDALHMELSILLPGTQADLAQQKSAIAPVDAGGPPASKRVHDRGGVGDGKRNFQ